MKKLLTLTLAAALCLSSLSLFGCVEPNLQADPETTDEIAQAGTDPEITAEITETGTPAETEYDPAIGQVLGITVLEIREDGYVKITVRDSIMNPNDDHMEGKEMLLHVNDDYCVNDWLGFTYRGLTGEEIDGIPVCKAERIFRVDKENMTDKPVIYLYPEAPTEVSVKLTLNGHLTCTYPDYEAGWNGFTAHPDGTLVFPDGKEYYCLYWEGMQKAEWDFSTGFCVKGSDTAAFLEWALAKQGLTPREANEFIIYWLPLIQENPYNVISFQTDAYTDTAVLEITPTPDSLLRVMMAYYPSDEAVEMVPQELEAFERSGFTVVEWGGSQVKHP